MIDTAARSSKLLEWFDREKRDLPWRTTHDPYAIAVSEAMLQQTQVRVVIPFYQRFLARFPDVETLARAEIDDVLHLWQGLGYYRRARLLKRAAEVVVRDFGGRFPQAAHVLQQLPGFGAYTSAAVASIAFDQPVACVDGNVTRVLTRLHGIDADVGAQATKAQIQLLASRAVSPTRPGDHNQAMMELGARICTPRKPDCPACPIARYCDSRAKGVDPESRPNKPTKARKRREDHVTLVLRRGNRLLLAKRPAKGLLAGLWEFPSILVDSDSQLRVEQIQAQSLDLGQVRHLFTHIDARYRVMTSDHERLAELVLNQGQESAWLKPDELAQYPLTRVVWKVLEQLEKHARQGSLFEPGSL